MNNSLTDMIHQALVVQQHAYAPYSNFMVGACVRTEDGTLFTGCNIENVSYSLTICAETAAISSAVSAGHRRIVEAVVVTTRNEICTPCGACRQRFAEFMLPDALLHLCHHQDIKKTLTMAELLPLPFSFSIQS